MDQQTTINAHNNKSIIHQRSISVCVLFQHFATYSPTNTLNPPTNDAYPHEHPKPSDECRLHINEHGFFVLTRRLPTAPATARFQHRRHDKVQILTPFSNPTPARSLLKPNFNPHENLSQKLLHQ